MKKQQRQLFLSFVLSVFFCCCHLDGVAVAGNNKNAGNINKSLVDFYFGVEKKWRAFFPTQVVISVVAAVVVILFSTSYLRCLFTLSFFSMVHASNMFFPLLLCALFFQRLFLSLCLQPFEIYMHTREH